MSDPRPLFSRNRREDFVGRLEVSSHHGGLVLEDGQQKRITDHVQLFVSQIESVIGRDVSEKVQDSAGRRKTAVIKDVSIRTCRSPVEMCDGDNLSSDVIIEPVDAVRVNEAIPDPTTRLHRLLDLSYHLQWFNRKHVTKRHDYSQRQDNDSRENDYFFNARAVRRPTSKERTKGVPCTAGKFGSTTLIIWIRTCRSR